MYLLILDKIKQNQKDASCFMFSGERSIKLSENSNGEKNHEISQ